MCYKLSTYFYLFIFLLCFTGYHSTRLFYSGPAALHWRGRGGGPQLAIPPAHDVISLNTRRLGEYEAKKPLNACHSQTAVFWRFIV